ncbi:MAG TPA: response regulator transcription factor [Kofleriaceae bacterium]|nr:response regulator transcription factor [Kofleriaceae bacterium]
MDALSLADTRSLDALRVAVVTLVTTPTTQAIVDELRRGAVRVDLVTIEVVQSTPNVPLYIISLDRVIVRAFADKLVEWSQRSELKPGLIGIIEDGDARDCEELLAAGFDDVLVTPVSPRELAGRVRALHRRVLRKTTTNGRLRFGNLTIDLYARTLWAGGKTIALTSIELAVLRELMKARGRPLSRSELLDAAWGEGELEVSERAVDNVILRLRRKLPKPELIETVRSVGFRLATS